MKSKIVIILISCYSFFTCTKPDNLKKDYLLDIPSPLSISQYKIPQDNPMSEEGVTLGRQLFYEKMLSSDSSISCGTCHQQEFAFSDGGQKFSKGVQNRIGNMQTMSLVNLLWQNQFFWNGRSASLEEQALEPITNHVELNLPIEQAIVRLEATEKYPVLFKEAFGSPNITSSNIARAIAQFERTLISGDSKYDKYKRDELSLDQSELRGEQLFFTHPDPDSGLRGANCGDCHSGFLTQANTFSNNGLDTEPAPGLMEFTGDQNDRGKFKIPTLRNIEVSSPYMHDGRFTTLEEVLDHYNEHIKSSNTLDPLIQEASNSSLGGSLELTEEEKKDVIAFLKTLTDQEFLNNEKFSDPN